MRGDGEVLASRRTVAERRSSRRGGGDGCRRWGWDGAGVGGFGGDSAKNQPEAGLGWAGRALGGARRLGGCVAAPGWLPDDGAAALANG